MRDRYILIFNDLVSNLLIATKEKTTYKGSYFVSLLYNKSPLIEKR